MDQNPQPSQSEPPKADDRKNLSTLVERLRSFESDIARLKGIPIEDMGVKKQEIKNYSVVPGEQKPSPYGIANEHKTEAKASSNVLETLQAAVESPEIPAVPIEEKKQAVENLHKQDPVQRFRTINTDAADTAQKQNTTVEDIVLAEQRRQATKPRDPVDSKQSLILLILSILLVLGGALAIGIFYLVRIKQNTPIQIAIDPNQVMITEGVQSVSLNTNDSLLSAFAQTTIQPPRTGSEVVKINFLIGTSTTPIVGPIFASMLSNNIPAWLARAFNDNYLAGIYETQGTWRPFIIFKVASYENAYAGMLKWETTLPSDFNTLITPLRQRPTETAAFASTTTKISTSTPILAPLVGFRDEIIKNKDVRVLEDASGRKLLLYSFPDRQTLVIAFGQPVFEEILARLATSQFVR